MSTEQQAVERDPALRLPRHGDVWRKGDERRWVTGSFSDPIRGYYFIEYKEQPNGPHIRTSQQSWSIWTDGADFLGGGHAEPTAVSSARISKYDSLMVDLLEAKLALEQIQRKSRDHKIVQIAAEALAKLERRHG